MDEKTYPNITVVDEHDVVIGYMQLFDAIAAGHIRRVVYVLVFNEKNEVLIQRRGEHVLNPCLLDASASGHVDEGDTYEGAAIRELEEELGLTGLPLTLVTDPFYTPHFYNAVFTANIGAVTIEPASNELASAQWVPFETLTQQIQDEAVLFTPEFVRIFKIVCDKITP